MVAAIKKVEEEGELVSDEVKAQILKNDKQANTILEETGTIDLLKTSQAINETANQKETDKVVSFEKAVLRQETPVSDAPAESSFFDLGIQVEENYDIEKVVANVTEYVQRIVDEMDVEATLSSNYNRRTINMQILPRPNGCGQDRACKDACRVPL